MGQKEEPSGANQVYVLGLDDDGNPRGARFTILKDSIVSAAIDMNCHVLISQPPAVFSLGMTLPVGYVRGAGKVVTLLVPKIGWKLYKQILRASRVASIHEATRIEATISHTIH